MKRLSVSLALLIFVVGIFITANIKADTFTRGGKKTLIELRCTLHHHPKDPNDFLFKEENKKTIFHWVKTVGRMKRRVDRLCKKTSKYSNGIQICYSSKGVRLFPITKANMEEIILTLYRKNGIKAQKFADKTPAELFSIICGQCHSFDRSLKKNKTKNDWQKTVYKMRNKLLAVDIKLWGGKIPILLTKENVDKIAQYLFEQQIKENTQRDNTVADLFESICGQCHSVSKALSKRQTRDKWQKTVEKMLSKLNNKRSKEDSALLFYPTHDETGKIIDYAFSKKGIQTKRTKQKKKNEYNKTTSSTSEAEKRRKKFLNKFSKTKARTTSNRSRKAY